MAEIGGRKRRRIGQKPRGVLSAVADGKGMKCPKCKQFAPLRPDGKYVCSLCGCELKVETLPTPE